MSEEDLANSEGVIRLSFLITKTTEMINTVDDALVKDLNPDLKEFYLHLLDELTEILSNTNVYLQEVKKING